MLSCNPVFHVEMFNMENQKQKNKCGVLMRYLVVVVACSSGKIYTDCVPRKHPVHVAHVLLKVIGILGPPLILHTEGKENVADKELLKMM